MKELEQQLTQIFNDNKWNVYGYISKRVENKEVIWDIHSLVFTDLWKYMQKGEPLKGEPKKLLFTIARWRILSWYTHVKAMGTLSTDSLAEDGFDPEDVTDDFYERADIRLARSLIPYMSASLRDLTRMRLIDGLPPEDIVKVTGQTWSAVTSKISRGIKELRNIYENGTKIVVKRGRNGKPIKG